jgi:hypothetical protein
VDQLPQIEAVSAAPPELRELILKLDALYPGDIDTQIEKLLLILAHGIKSGLDAETLATLRADAAQWPESIQKLLAAEGVR